MSISLTNIYKNEIAICALAQLGTEKKILQALSHRRKDNIKHFWKDLPYSRQFRRGQGGWVKDTEGRLMADRILSLYKKMYKDTQFDRPINGVQLLNMYYAYNALYPNSKIHPTRIFYFFPLVREQLLGIMPSCACCSKSYVVHYDDNVDINICASCDINGAKITNVKREKHELFAKPVVDVSIDDNLPQRQQV